MLLFGHFLYIYSLLYFKMVQSLIYYLGLYIVVICVNYFKLLKEYKKPDAATPAKPFEWRRVFYVSSEFIYTSAGVIIIILKDQPTWIPVVLIAVLILMIFSININSLEERFPNKASIFWIHIILIIFIMGGTAYTFYNQDQISQSSNKSDSTCCYKISIPYQDRTLLRHYGYEKMENTYLNYTIALKSKNERTAIKSAVDSFWNDTSITPLIYSKGIINKRNTFKIDTNNILVKDIK
jgi:hypothetical protein